MCLPSAAQPHVQVDMSDAMPSTIASAIDTVKGVKGTNQHKLPNLAILSALQKLSVGKELPPGLSELALRGLQAGREVHTVATTGNAVRRAARAGRALGRCT